MNPEIMCLLCKTTTTQNTGVAVSQQASEAPLFIVFCLPVTVHDILTVIDLSL